MAFAGESESCWGVVQQAVITANATNASAVTTSLSAARNIHRSEAPQGHRPVAVRVCSRIKRVILQTHRPRAPRRARSMRSRRPRRRPPSRTSDPESDGKTSLIGAGSTSCIVGVAAWQA